MAIQLRDVVIARTLHSDLSNISSLHAGLFGPGRFARTAYRVREAGPDISPFCRTAKCHGRLVATITFTEICIGGRAGALLLGPLAVCASYANLGIGRALVHAGLAAAKTSDLQLIVLIGDLSYYARIGFVPIPAGQLVLPGPLDPDRLLACELRQYALRNYRGAIRAVNLNGA